MSEPEKNQYGVRCVIGDEDFTKWEWGAIEHEEFINKISSDAANVVIGEIAKDISLDVFLHDDGPVIVGLMFECSTEFRRPLLDAVAEWIEDNVHPPADDDERQNVERMIAGFEKAIGMLRAAITQSD